MQLLSQTTEDKTKLSEVRGKVESCTRAFKVVQEAELQRV